MYYFFFYTAIVGRCQRQYCILTEWRKMERSICDIVPGENISEDDSMKGKYMWNGHCCLVGCTVSEKCILDQYVRYEIILVVVKRVYVCSYKVSFQYLKIVTSRILFPKGENRNMTETHKSIRKLYSNNITEDQF